MSYKKFLEKTLVVSLLLVAACVSANIYVDEFGLFRSVRNRHITIPVSERASKYLLSYRYVPVNFESILIGPSLSDQLNTEKLRSIKTYNLSLLGANASELKVLAENVIKRGNIRALIICLDPFITRESGINDTRMRPQMYWSTLGSTFTCKYYSERLKHYLAPLGEKYEYNAYGAANIRESVDSSQAIRGFAQTVRKQRDVPVFVDQQAFADLKELIRLARQKGVKIIAFYYPMPYGIFIETEKRYRDYQRKMNSLFTATDVVWDFNTDAYMQFRKDYRNYSDQGHISRSGADFILGVIDQKVAESL